MKFSRCMQKMLMFFMWIAWSLSFPNFSEAGNKDTIALVMKSLSNPFFSKMEIGAREYAAETDIDLEVFGLENETDIDRQISIVEDLISRGYGAIVIAPADSKKLVAVCKKAQQKGIVVINIDNPLHKPTMDKAGISIPFVGSDNYAGAHMVGIYLKKKLQGHGRVLIIEGITGVENADLRKKGFADAVTKNSSIEIAVSESANWHTEEALSVAARLLYIHQDIDAIFCANDAMALGAMQAIDLLGLSEKIMIAGYDNIDSVRTEIRNGRINATIEQHPELMGKYGVELAFEKLRGNEIPQYKSTPLDLISSESFNKKVALSISSLQDSFFTILAESSKNTADLLGMDLMIFDAKNEDAQQLNDIAAALAQKVDLLIINPTSSQSVYPGIELANTAGTPVITVDRKVSGGKILCHIESDNVQGGRMAGELMAQQLQGKGKVLELEGIPGTSAAYERGRGFYEALAPYDGIDVVLREVANFNREEARSLMLGHIRQLTFFDGVFAHNDNMILGVLDAFEKSGVNLPRVLIGFDAIPEAKKAISENRLTASIVQEPVIMAKLAVETAARYFRGEKIPSTLSLGLKLVTRQEGKIHVQNHQQ